MRRPAQRHVLSVAAALTAVALLAGCSLTGDPAAGGTPPASEAPEGSEVPSEEPSDPAPIAVDFASGGATVTLDNGWRVGHCEGEAPFLCVSDGDRLLGSVEYGSYPLSDDLAVALAEGRLVEALEARIAEQHEAIAADRAIGCGPDYEYVALPAQRTTVGGEPAVVYGFSGVVDGREVERHRSYFLVHAGQFWVVGAPASDPEGCMGTDLPEFAPADLVTFEPYLDRIVAGSELPAEGRAVTDGIVIGTEGGLDGGLLYVAWGGGKQRIQQPAAFFEEEMDERGLEWGPAIANLAVADGETGSYFAVVPPDGADARLTVAIDGVLHPVVIQQIAKDVVDTLPDLDELVLTRLTLPGS